MQAIYLLDQSVNILTAPAAWRDKCKPVLDEAGDVVDWIIPKGTIVEGAEALLRVSTGQCTPFDEECVAAVGATQQQLEATQRQYLAASVGIKGKKDMELFMAGVIEGYGPKTTDENPVYLPGANYDAWQAAKDKLKTDKGMI